MDHHPSYRYPTDIPKAGYLPPQGASSLFDPPKAQSEILMYRRIPHQHSDLALESVNDMDQPFNTTISLRAQPASGTGRRSSWTREIAVPPRHSGSYNLNRAVAVTALSETQPGFPCLLKKAVETSALMEGSPVRPKFVSPEAARRGSLPGRRRSLMTKAQIITSRGPSLLALYEQRPEQVAGLARTAQAVVMPQSEPRRRSRSLPAIHRPASSSLEARKRDLGITALHGFAWIPDTTAEAAKDHPVPDDEDSFVFYTSESLITPSEDFSMAHLQQSTSHPSQSSMKRPIFSDPFGRTSKSMAPMYEEEEHLDRYSSSPNRTTSANLDLRPSPTNRFATVNSRPVIHRYRTAPATTGLSSGLNILFDPSFDDPDMRQSFWIDRRDQDVLTGSIHSTTPNSDMTRTFSSVQMTRQTRRLSDSNSTRPDAPVIGSQGRARSGRFDSVVSWRSKRGSWAAVSLVEDSFVDEADENRWFGDSQSSALDAIMLPAGGRTRFDSIDTAMRNHQAHGGMWGGELPAMTSSFKRGQRPEQVSVNQVRRGTEGALPVYIDMGDHWVRL